VLNRALKALLLSPSIFGVVYVAVTVDPWRPIGPVPLAPGIAGAQTSGAPIRYRVVAERSEARYRVREQLAGLNFPSDAVGATRAIEGSIAFDTEGRVISRDSRFSVDLRTL